MTTRNPFSPTVPLAEVDGDQFVGRMFSGFGRASTVRPAAATVPAEEPYRALHQSKATPGVAYRLHTRTPELRVLASSPATDVMTDLSRVVAITIAPGADIDEARQTMIGNGVRALFVVDDASAILGILTANDIVGEKPIQVAQTRGVRHAEVLVSEVMTPAHRLEAMELQEVLQVRVGDIVETLKRAGRQHALVIDSGAAQVGPATRTVRGMFSLTQIARQLGLPTELGRDVARTVAEIEARVFR